MKKIIYGILGIVVILAIVFLFTSRNNKIEPTRLSIGAISSETGAFAAIGQAFSQGIKFAHEEYTKSNPNTQISLSVEDDGSESKKGLSAYNKLVSFNKIDGLINLSSPTISIVYDSVTSSKLPVIQLGEQDRDPADDTVYQVYPTQDAPEVATGEFVKKMSNGNDTVLFYTNDSTVMKFVNNIKKGYDAPFIEEFKLDQNQKEYATIVAKAMAHNPKIVVLSAYSSNGARVVKEILKYPNKPTIVFDLIYDGAEYAGVFPDLSVLDGSYVMTLKSQMDPMFVEKYKARYGAEPSIFAGYGYDAFNTFVSGYDADSKIMSKNMKSLSLKGVTGNISFNKEGLRQPEFGMKVIKGGVLSEIQ